jgi:hypothetical protein
VAAGGLAGLQRLGDTQHSARPVGRDSAFCEPVIADIHAPLVEAEVAGADGRHAIDQEKGGMPAASMAARHLADVAGDAGCCLVVRPPLRP